MVDTMTAKQHNLGWHVLTVWECELRDLDRVAARIRKFLLKSETSHHPSVPMGCATRRESRGLARPIRPLEGKRNG